MLLNPVKKSAEQVTKSQPGRGASEAGARGKAMEHDATMRLHFRIS